MSTYLVGDITVHNPQGYRDYVSQVSHFVAKYQGKYLIRGGDIEVKEGDWHPERLVIIEFPTQEHAQGFLKDPEYQPVAAIRQATATSNLLLVEGQ
ncbi:MAG: DUF1330 domain-containing protein [Gammaproteobacteria bacterium]|nr:DUF1330 domain-containing protein [Gammaproteobacteria bacterium]